MRPRSLEAFARDDATREAMLRANPEIAVDLTAATHATFTRADLARTIDTFVSSPDAFQATLAAAETSPQLVDLTGVRGIVAVGMRRERQIVLEQGIIDVRAVLAARAHAAPSAVRGAGRHRCDRGRAWSAPAMARRRGCPTQQLRGARCADAADGVDRRRRAWRAPASRRCWRPPTGVGVSAGCTVHGAALAGIATRGLQSASGIPSRTVASWLAAWEAGTHLLSRG